MRSLFGIEISLDFHILLSTMKAALAFAICTSSRASPCSVIGLLLLLWIFMILVLPLFTFNSNVIILIMCFVVFGFGCAKEEPDDRQNQDLLAVPIVPIVNHFAFLV